MNNHTTSFSELQQNNFSLNNEAHILERNARKLPITVLKIFNRLIFLANNYKEVHASQTKIALMAGFCRETANRKFNNELTDLGLVNKTWRGVKKTCLYTLNKWFYDPSFRNRLSDILPNLKWVPVFLLATNNTPFSTAGKVDSYGIVTQCSSLYLNNSSVISSVKELYSQEYMYKVKTKSNSNNQNKEKLQMEMSKDLLKTDGNLISNSGTELKNDNVVTEIPKYILELPLDLTLAGQITLLAYPEELLMDSITVLRRKKVDDPFRYLLAICNKKMTESGITHNWTLVNQLKLKYKIDYSAKNLNSFALKPDLTPKRANPEVKSSAQRLQESRQTIKVEEQRDWALTDEQIEDQLKIITDPAMKQFLRDLAYRAKANAHTWFGQPNPNKNPNSSPLCESNDSMISPPAPQRPPNEGLGILGNLCQKFTQEELCRPISAAYLALKEQELRGVNTSIRAKEGDRKIDIILFKMLTQQVKTQEDKNLLVQLIEYDSFLDMSNIVELFYEYQDTPKLNWDNLTGPLI